jgi:hypothetical protein
VLGACITGIGISLILTEWITAPLSLVGNLLFSGGIIILAGISLIPWLLPEIRDILKL